jgi:hypothetical protein
MTFTLFFRLPMQLGIYNQNFLFPMEYSCFWVIGFFLLLEFVIGIFTIRKIINTQTALFYLRNAKLVDPKYNKTYKAKDRQIKSSREIAIGLNKLKENTHYINQWLKEPEWMRPDYSFDRSDSSN